MMSFMSRYSIAGAVAVALAAGTACAGPARSGEAAEAAARAAEAIANDYVDARKASVLAARLRKEAAAISRNGKQGEVLARELTALLQSLSGDAHFRFGYSAETMPPDIFAAKPGGDAEAAAQRTARINNFGVLKAERLPGNVGLIDLDQFTDPARMRAPLAAAMELLRHCDALIVDLRWNGGGHARGAALAASYFLPAGPERPLVRLENRNPAEAVEIGTVSGLDGPRFLDKPVYVVTGPKTFSAAEMFTSVLRQAGRATVVGSKTRGGGNPVTRIRLSDHYALLLPTTRTVVHGGMSWEGVGVVPDVAADEKDALKSAHRAALSALLEARPDDMLAGNWRTLIGELAPPAAAPSQPPSGAVE
jgi:hypothetical protein